MWKLLSLLLCALACDITAGVETNCSINLDDIKGFAPVIATYNTDNDYHLFKPTGRVNILRGGIKLLLLCNGKGNSFRGTTVNVIKLYCSSSKGHFVNSVNFVLNLSELVCKNIPSSTLQITSERCSNNNGVIYNIGFNYNNIFIGPVYKVCYDNYKEHTFYSHVTLNGAAMDYRIVECKRRPFSASGMQLTFSKANNIYKQTNQISRFKKYFGPFQTYISAKKFLARGHLAADTDFIFGYEQLATFYYVNAAPEFQVVNVGNWLRVEELARTIASLYRDDIESYNGYMDVLELPGKNNKPVQVFLDTSYKIEVPKYFYKILVHKATDSAIVFVTVNNPYINDGPAQKFCTNVCKQAGIYHVNFPDTRKGYTFCCRLNEFKTKVNSLPAEVQGSKLLRVR